MLTAAVILGARMKFEFYIEVLFSLENAIKNFFSNSLPIFNVCDSYFLSNFFFLGPNLAAIEQQQFFFLKLRSPVCGRIV